jgi:hypothetical protein
MTRTQHTSGGLRFARAFSFGVAAYVVLYAAASPSSSAPAWQLAAGALATGAVVAMAGLAWRALRRIANGPERHRGNTPADDSGPVTINLFATGTPGSVTTGTDGSVTRRSA